MSDHIILHFQNEPLALEALTILTAVIVLAILVWHVATLYLPTRRGAPVFRSWWGSVRRSPRSGEGPNE